MTNFNTLPYHNQELMSKDKYGYQQGLSSKRSKGKRVSEFSQTIGFIGGGNMGEAIVGATLAAGLLPPVMIHVADADVGRRTYLAEKYRVVGVESNVELFETCQIVVLAVKPQQMPLVLEELVRRDGYCVLQRKLVISIAAGFPIRKIENFLYPPLNEQEASNLPIIRVMPNTPALVLRAVSAMSPNRFATPEDIRTARTLLEAIGVVITFEEEDLDAVTALSGSGPAYFFYLVEALIDAGITAGLAPEAAATLVTQTFMGSVKLLEASGESPRELRRKVTSPGGTTEAAIDVFESRGFKPAVIEAIAAAAKRAHDLSK